VGEIEMNVLSLFDGMSCGQIALNRSGIKYDNYFASEVDKYSIKVTQANYSNTIQLGDVTKIDVKKLPYIDLLIGGSPCQGFSFAGKQLNFNDERSKLFFEYVRILNDLRKINPNIKFILENVLMKSIYHQPISRLLGYDPVLINSALVSAQNRERLYWTNIEGDDQELFVSRISQPEDKHIYLKDILQDLPDCPIGYKVRKKSKCIRIGGKNSPIGSKQEWDSPFQRISKKGNLKNGIEKAACLTGGGNSGGNHSDMDIIHTPLVTRRYSAIECERLQTVPDNYTNHVSNSQRYKMLGNGFTVDVICHILKGLKWA
jgi:DNA-cytosine methyltransferase